MHVLVLNRTRNRCGSLVAVIKNEDAGGAAQRNCWREFNRSKYCMSLLKNSFSRAFQQPRKVVGLLEVNSATTTAAAK